LHPGIGFLSEANAIEKSNPVAASMIKIVMAIRFATSIPPLEESNPGSFNLK
jgi:hypothetical protein